MTNRLQQQTVLVLEDNPADALLLKQMIDSVPERYYRALVHQSSQGIFPSLRDSAIIFLGERYANTDLLQLLSLISSQYPTTPIVLLSNNELPPQLLIDAARHGLAQILDKGSLSRDSLERCLQQIEQQVTGSESKPSLTPEPKPAPIVPTLNSPVSDVPPKQFTADTKSSHSQPDAEPTDGAAAQRQEKQQQDRKELDKGLAPKTDPFENLTTAVIRLTRKGDDFIVSSINRAACISEQLEAKQVLGAALKDIKLDYANLSLTDTLRDIQPGQATIYQGALRIDSQGVNHWRDVSVRNLGKEILIELYDCGERSERQQQSVQNPEKGPENSQSPGRALSTEKNELWQNVVSSLPDLTALLNEDGRIVNVIAGNWRQIRTDPKSLTGETFSSLLPEGERQQCRELLSKALNTGKPQQVVFRLELADGPLWLHTKLSLLRADAGGERFALLLASDISEQFEQHESLFSELSLMKEFLRRAPFALAIKDNDGRFERANPYFLDLFGLRNDDVIGKTEADLFGDKLAADLLTLEQAMLQSGDVVEAHFAPGAEYGENYRFIKMPLPKEGDPEHASCLLVLTANDLGMTETVLQPPLVSSTFEASPVRGSPTQGTQWLSRREKKKTDLEQHHLSTEHRVSTEHQVSTDQHLSIEQLVTGIASDFNKLMLGASSETQHSSRHAHELILKMLAYRDAKPAHTKSADMSETSRRTIKLLEQSTNGRISINTEVDDGIYADELDVVEVQKLLIDMFRHLNMALTLGLRDKNTTAIDGNIKASMRLTVHLDQTCVCCFNEVSGYYLELALASGDHYAEPAQTIRNLNSDLSDDDALVSNMLSLHANIKRYDGHIMLNIGPDGSQSWRMLLPIAGNGIPGIQLDTGIDHAKPQKAHRD